MRHLEDMHRGRFSVCTRRIRDSSQKELQELNGRSFVARAVYAMWETSPNSWNVKEMELMDYINVAIDKGLEVNDAYNAIYRNFSTLELAASMGLLNLLSFLLDRGYPLKPENRCLSAVNDAAKYNRYEALELMLSRRTDEARLIIKGEAAHAGWFTTFYRVVENFDLTSFRILHQFGCIEMSDKDAYWIFQVCKSKRYPRRI
jgi:hypothetical protein